MIGFATCVPPPCRRERREGTCLSLARASSLNTVWVGTTDGSQTPCDSSPIEVVFSGGLELDATDVG